MALLTPPTPGDLPMRNTISFGMPSSGALLRPGDATFNETLFNHFPSREAVALEKAISLKARIRRAPLEDFWRILSQGLADVCGAQVAFISQRLAGDDAEEASAAIKDGPPADDPDGFLCALAWYFQDRQGQEHVRRNTRYFGWGCPCAAMKYGQVFLIPSRLQEHSPNNPNNVFRSLGVDAYIGVPLFYNGKCNAHFGLAWSSDGSRERQLSWPLIESICHSFEDLILQRILEGATVQSTSDHDAASQSGHEVTEAGKPFIPPVHILSHELRTPMQGVVGMLDLMHDIVQDAVDGQQNTRAREVFRSLKHDIETIQESSKRAVDAADHVVQAYEREMMGPARSASTRETSPVSSDAAAAAATAVPSPRHGSFPLQLVETSPRVGEKRRLSASAPEPEQPAAKLPRLDTHNGERTGSPKPVPHHPDHEARKLEFTHFRNLLKAGINDSFRSAGRPASVESRTVHNGQHFEARYENPDGSSNVKHIDLLVDSSVPQTVSIVPDDFQKVISCLLQNAIKFTSDANIILFARLELAGQVLVVNVRDNGPGIDLDFQTQLFVPFQKAENSIRRRTEGLGLGLVVARSIAEKMGGVLNLASAETEGPGRGCDFEFRLPLSQSAQSGPESRRVSVASSAPSSRRPSMAGSLLASASPGAQSPIHARRQLSASKTQGKLAADCPLSFLVVEDNHINRKLLVNMLLKLGYNPRTQVHEAFDGAEAVRMATNIHRNHGIDQAAGKPVPKSPIDVILMDLWMPRMDGYEATERILTLFGQDSAKPLPTVWAVTADATAAANANADRTGMLGVLKKPFQMRDLERVIKETYEHRAKASTEEGGEEGAIIKSKEGKGVEEEVIESKEGNGVEEEVIKSKEGNGVEEAGQATSASTSAST